MNAGAEEIDRIFKEIDRIFKGGNRALATALLEITQEMRDYWPLTVRQVFYQAVSRLILENAQSEYRKVSTVLVKLRENDLLPWSCIADRTRRTVDKRGVPNVGEFIQEQMESFLNWRYYGRCYIQNQEVYVEVATEKDALASILEDAVYDYCTRLNIVRGQVSATMVNNMAERFDRAVMLGKRPVLVHFGDLDPSGVSIPKALQRNLMERHGIKVELIRAALNPEQIQEYKLPEMFDAAKKADPNYGVWLKTYGPDQSPVELDALHPRDLTAVAQQTLESLYDMSSVEVERENEQDERRLLKVMHREVQDFIFERWPEVLR